MWKKMRMPSMPAWNLCVKYAINRVYGWYTDTEKKSLI